MAAIVLDEVTKWFGNFQALAEISLAIETGEFVSLVGPSGCGKTTTLRIIAGLERPTSGRVRINDDSPLAACRQRKIGVAFQKPALIPSKTALENVELSIEIARRRNCLSPVSLLTDFGIDEASQRKYPHQLSGGMQQRVDFACAMVYSPEILFLDEPFGPLDLITRELMGEWLESVLWASPKTVVLVTHGPDEAVFHSNRVIVFSPQPGRILGAVKVDIPKPRSRKTRLTPLFNQKVVEVKEMLYSGMNEGG